MKSGTSTGQHFNHLVRDNLESQAKQQRQPSLVIQQFKNERSHVLMANDGRLGRKWMFTDSDPQPNDLLQFLDALSASYEKPLLIWPHGQLTRTVKQLARESNQHAIELANGRSATLALTAYPQQPVVLETVTTKKTVENSMDMTHLDRLEAESIHIIREVMAESENPVMMYSIGKDSSVMLQPGPKGLLPQQTTLPVIACGHPLEVPGHV